eukprot:SAG11_NODE_14615_length_605_cov_3.203557_1_plen_75_part_10
MCGCARQLGAVMRCERAPGQGGAVGRGARGGGRTEAVFESKLLSITVSVPPTTQIAPPSPCERKPGGARARGRPR